MRVTTFKFAAFALLIFVCAVAASAQKGSKRNDRPQETSSPAPQRAEENKKPADQTRYSYEFRQPEFVIRHILIEHDAYGHGKITFERHGEETPIVEPVELSASAWGRISGFWSDLKFLDSNE